MPQELTHTLPDGTVIEVSEPRWDLGEGWHYFDFVTRSEGRIVTQYEAQVNVRIGRYGPEAHDYVMVTTGDDVRVPAYLEGVVRIAGELALADAFGFVPNIQAAE